MKTKTIPKSDVSNEQLARMLSNQISVFQTSMNQKFEVLDKRFNKIDKRFEMIDRRFDEERKYNEKRFDAIEKKLKVTGKLLNRINDNQKTIWYVINKVAKDMNEDLENDEL